MVTQQGARGTSQASLNRSGGSPWPVRVVRLGRLRYEEAWRWQKAAAESVRAGSMELLALLEHPPVYTFGRRSGQEHLLLAPDEIYARGAELIESDRGGDVTFHGPGQLVVYPILDLRARSLGAADYVRCLEAMLILALQDVGVAGCRVAGRPGVWVRDSKIASIGVRVARGVTTHGLALNVETDLSWFDLIVPCGIEGVRMTSLEGELGVSPGMDCVEDAVVKAFDKVFDSRLVADSAPAEERQALALGV